MRHGGVRPHRSDATAASPSTAAPHEPALIRRPHAADRRRPPAVDPSRSTGRPKPLLTLDHGFFRVTRPVIRDVLPLGDGSPLLRWRHHHELVQLRQEISSGFLRQRRESNQQPEHLSHVAHGLTLPSSVEITRHPAMRRVCLPRLTPGGLRPAVPRFSYRPGPCAATADIAFNAGRLSVAPAGKSIPRRRAMRASARRRSASITGLVNMHSTFDAA